MSELRFSYAPPTGKPLGTNLSFKVFSAIVIALLNTIAKVEWKGAENIPKSGPVIVANNHLSYMDVLFFVHFLYRNGRAPRFIGKAAIFRVPIIGSILLASGQVPVERESSDAAQALERAKAMIAAGHMLGIYPEGTLSRDSSHWPMVAKTGLARLAIITKAPVIPIAQWGSHNILPAYSKRVHLWPRRKVVIHAGQVLDFSPWYGKENDQAALIEATAYAMASITKLLEDIRGEKRPTIIFDPHRSDLPRIGNFKREKKK